MLFIMPQGGASAVLINMSQVGASAMLFIMPQGSASAVIYFAGRWRHFSVLFNSSQHSSNVVLFRASVRFSLERRCFDERASVLFRALVL